MGFALVVDGPGLCLWWGGPLFLMGWGFVLDGLGFTFDGMGLFFRWDGHLFLMGRAFVFDGPGICFDGLGICVLLVGDQSRNERSWIGWDFVFDGLGLRVDRAGLCFGWAGRLRWWDGSLLLEDRRHNEGRLRPEWKGTEARVRGGRGRNEGCRGQDERRS